jgi:hypothetical protein
MATLIADPTPGLWAAAPGTGGDAGDGALLGLDAEEKVGFFGATPVTRPVVPLTTPDAQDVIDALVALGLITQAD